MIQSRSHANLPVIPFNQFFRNGTTPDGYKVDGEGRWLPNGVTTTTTTTSTTETTTAEETTKEQTTQETTVESTTVEPTTEHKNNSN